MQSALFVLALHPVSWQLTATTKLTVWALRCTSLFACGLQRLGRENAALLERAGIDDLGDLTTKDLNLQAMQQQQQLLPDAAGSAAAAVATPDVPSAEIAVEALSVQDQQQQQQQREEEEEELPEEFRDFAEMLEGVVDWGNDQAKMAAALDKLGTRRLGVCIVSYA
jgi:FKBP-type peptidyl-prolyl cis-trans isomerase (trigger factor)